MTEYYNSEKGNREVYCSECKTYSFSDKPAPKCPTCKNNLVKVIRNAISGQRITGEENGITREN